MKATRFFSVFFLMALVVNLLAFPVSAAETSLPADPDIQAKAALLVDANTGNIVYAKNEHHELYPASLTKIMTALLVLEAVDSGKLSLDQQLTASDSITELDADGSSAGIKVGEVMTVEQLLYCMLVVSANEACVILAEAVSGDVDTFVDAMNAKAQALGCENTHFVNPTGLHDSQHYTSAWDLYLITQEAMKHEDFMRICDTGDITLPATNLSEARSLHSTNYLISVWRSRGYYNTDAHGVKTGSTGAAGHCLVSSASKGSLSFISVMLGCEQLHLEGNEIRTMSFYETNRLFDWAFDNFAYQTVLTSDEILKEVAVSLSKIDHVTVHPAEDVEVLLPKGLAAEDLERTITLKSDPVEAPISAGDVLGTVTLSYDGTDYATVDLLALNDVEASRILTFWRDVKAFFSQTAVKVVGIILLAAVVALLVWKLVFGRRRYRYGRSVNFRSRRGYRGRRR
ncbi:D-alanyl-D-alanine carboxypeptidase family protein [uncultured Oscillibacter sp.]|uniref:D-alanyl-D-alanine carboxypeptidase family protein n=1 Tax=uncultured Oscillibacter sp. TaxID=876091 RepID=UPI00280B72FE|nr:D-alanyl-D-alanine carboxypeptidase family protein [uncultured Oscillibacter sp.]